MTGRNIKRRIKMVARIWTKKETQQTLKELRHNGYKVEKIHTGFYKAWDVEGYIIPNELVFSALLMRNGYICRLNPDYFDAE